VVDERKTRRALGLFGALAGVLLFGLELRWSGAGDARVFVGKLWGWQLFEAAPEHARAVALRLAPGAGAGAFDLSDAWTLVGWGWLALALSFGGLWVAPRLAGGAAGLGMRSAAALATLFAASPWLPLFVTTRMPLGATAYLGLEDQAHALGLALIFLGAAFALRFQKVAGHASLDGPRSLIAAVVLSVLLPLGLSHGFLGGQPLTNDGVAYQFQAELFAAGELASDIGPLADFFPARQVLPGPIATSKYPPGHAATLRGYRLLTL